MIRQFFVLLFALVLFFIPPAVFAADITTTEKLITVDTGSQMLRAWEGGKVIYESKVSTGLPLSPTIKGSFKIYYKLANQATMRGYSPYKGKYFYRNVPHVMYFHESYGIHGAYWHNNFGVRMSNGCVNVPLDTAAKLFDFAPVGTRVEVY